MNIHISLLLAKNILSWRKSTKCHLTLIAAWNIVYLYILLGEGKITCHCYVILMHKNRNCDKCKANFISGSYARKKMKVKFYKDVNILATHSINILIFIYSNLKAFLMNNVLWGDIQTFIKSPENPSEWFVASVRSFWVNKLQLVLKKWRWSEGENDPCPVFTFL